MLLPEEDAVAQEGATCSSVHLARDQLGLDVDALGGPVAARQGERGGHGVAASVQAAGEGVQVGCSDEGDFAHECVGVFGVPRKERGSPQQLRSVPTEAAPNAFDITFGGRLSAARR
ncbi:hypothetical protein [Streptomyces sp. ACA25]|uniref:hypothetical protein n=1 Tax=Streptomyces sp. ACA25 TaxID=3022596 RepID=UPI003FA781D2